MKPARPGGLLRGAALLLPTLGWMVPIFTQLHKRYPCLGSVMLPSLSVGAGFTLLCLGLYFANGLPKATSRRTVITTTILIAVMALVSGMLWMPILNAWLDFGAARAIDGHIDVIERPGKGQPTRRATAVIDGETLEGAFYAQDFFWGSRVVRDGGEAKLRVGRGLFGVPWIAKVEEP